MMISVALSRIKPGSGPLVPQMGILSQRRQENIVFGGDGWGVFFRKVEGGSATHNSCQTWAPGAGILDGMIQVLCFKS